MALRPWRIADVAAMTAACRDPEIQRWTMVPDAYSEEHARGFVAHTEAARDTAASLELAIVDASNADDVLGAVGLVTIDWPGERADVGYWTAPQARRRGVAVRAGYTREGVLRSYFRSKTGLVDVVMYSLLRDDPAAQSATRSSAS